MPTTKKVIAVPVCPASARTPAKAIAILGGFLANIFIIALIGNHLQNLDRANLAEYTSEVVAQ
jgi:hypothetical protein